MMVKYIMPDVKTLSDKQLKVWIANYRNSGVNAGGNFSLAELLIEQGLRIDTGHDPRKIIDVICTISRHSEDGLTSYKAIWEEFYPGEKFIGNGSQKRVGKILGVAAAFCASNGFPALTTLVVPHDSRKITDLAIENIYNAWIEFGQDVEGLNSRAFYEKQLQKSKEFAQRYNG